jgi:hypothetical protein
MSSVMSRKAARRASHHKKCWTALPAASDPERVLKHREFGS